LAKNIGQIRARRGIWASRIFLLATPRVFWQGVAVTEPGIDHPRVALSSNQTAKFSSRSWSFLFGLVMHNVTSRSTNALPGNSRLWISTGAFVLAPKPESLHSIFLPFQF